MEGYLISQMLIVFLSTFLIVVLIGNKHPFKKLNSNYSQLASESVILITANFLLISTDPAVPPKSRTQIGYCMIAIVCIYLFLSQGSITISSFRTTKLACRRCLAKKKAKSLKNKAKDNKVTRSATLATASTPELEHNISSRRDRIILNNPIKSDRS